MKAPVGLILFGLACLVAAGVPWRAETAARSAGTPGFPGWPASFEGRPLRETVLNAAELAFNDRFPGRMGRFTDGARLIVLRWVTAPTHRVHSGSDCQQSAGSRLTRGEWWRDPDGAIWSTWTASGPGGVMTVRERCYDSHGGTWPDL